MIDSKGTILMEIKEYANVSSNYRKTIEFEPYPKGIYIVEITFAGKTSREYIIKK